MNKREIAKFRKLLFDERARIGGELRQIEESNLNDKTSNAGSDFNSLAEVGTDNFERETALKVASTEAGLLQDIDEALRRCEDGTYGDCLGCEKPIMRKRLEVNPSARFCIECQSKYERDGYL